MKKILITIAVLALGALIGARAQDAPEEGLSGYVVEEIQGGSVQVLEAGSKDWTPAQEGQVLETGDEIRTGKGSQASLTLGADTSLFLGPEASLVVSDISENGQGGFFSRLKLVAGRLLSDVKKDLASSRSSFEVEANGVVCGVRGTAFEITAGDGQFDLAVHEGKVQAGEGGRLVQAGYLAGFRAGRFLLQRRLERLETGRFQEWRKLRKAILLKRLQRLEEIRQHHRKPWKRRHPRLRRALIRKALQQNHRP